MISQMGKVVPFALSAGRMRRGAEEYRRRGQMVEAVELLRRAAEKEDSPLGWLRLAEQLRRLGCYEQATEILFRLLARENVLPDTWMELGRCQWALGKGEQASDSLYHYLAEDPYSDAADEARDILNDLEKWDEKPEKLRLNGLMRRALAAWKEGRRDLGMRRVKRAIRIAQRPGKIYITLALILLSEEDYLGAIRALSRAHRLEPGNLRAAAMLAVAMNARGCKRAALGMLCKCEDLCAAPEWEELYLTSAWTMDAPVEAFLLKRLKQQPLRISLMHAMADLQWHKNENEQAEKWWQRILRLDPGDLRARTLLKWTKQFPDAQLPPAGMLPAQAVQDMLGAVDAALKAGQSPDMMLRPGSDACMALHQCFAMTDERIQQLALEAIIREDTPLVRQALRELLVSPRTVPDVRQKVMLHLAQLGEAGPMNILLGTKISTAECTAVKHKKGLWRAFLGHLLSETEHRSQAEEIVAFAADIWPCLKQRQRLLAVGQHSYLWVKGMEIMYLQVTGQEAAVMRHLRDLMVSRRKLGRVLRVIAGHIG